VAKLIFKLFFTGLFGIIPLALLAQGNVTFEAKSDQSEVVVGSRFQVEFELKNEEGRRFEPPAFSPFKVVEGPMMTTGMSIINGSVSKKQGWGYVLQAPASQGSYTIPPATVYVGKQAIRTQPLTIRVAASRGTTGGNNGKVPDSKEEVFVRAELSTATAYVGQQVALQYKLYTRVPVEGFDLIELPDFKAFFTQEKRRFDTRVNTVKIRGKEYATRVLHEIALYPQKSGTLAIGSTGFKLGIEDPNMFGGLFGPTPVVFNTPAIELKVKDLPQPAPPDFSGAVGQYNWEVQADRQSLTTDDALVLRIAWRGNGDTRRMAVPKPIVPEGMDIFEPKIKEEEEYENGEQYIHSKTVEYDVLPKEPGQYTLQPTLTVFDPDSNRYVVLRTTPISLSVSQGKGYNQPIAPLDSPSDQAQSGMLLNFLRESWWWLALLAAIGLLIFFLWRDRGTTEKPKNQPETTELVAAITAPVPTPVKQPEPAPLTPTIPTTPNLMPLVMEEPHTLYSGLSKQIQGYCSARLGIDAASWSKETLRRTLQAKQVPDTVTDSLLNILQTCEQALYAGQIQAPEERVALVLEAERCLAQV
jgi:BatD DUF11 like domain